MINTGNEWSPLIAIRLRNMPFIFPSFWSSRISAEASFSVSDGKLNKVLFFGCLIFADLKISCATGNLSSFDEESQTNANKVPLVRWETLHYLVTLWHPLTFPSELCGCLHFIKCFLRILSIWRMQTKAMKECDKMWKSKISMDLDTEIMGPE